MKHDGTSSGRRRVRSRLIVAGVLATGSLLLAGCASTEVDEKRAREAILYDVEQKTGVKVDWVKCPSGVEVVPGTEFECRVKAGDGRVAIARMEVLNLDADVRFVSLKAAGG